MRKLAKQSSQRKYATCMLCEAMCGIEVELQDGQISAIRGDMQDPFSRGHICPKAPALKQLHEDADRLQRPLRRTADGWQAIEWDDAFDYTAERIHRIQQRHGKDAVGMYFGNPTVHSLGAILYGLPFLKTLATRNRYSATSVDQLPHMLVAYLMFGHQLLLPVPDLDHTNYFLILGANPVVSNGSLMGAPDIKNRLKAIRARGGKIICVDPRRTETARLADEHLFIEPGTDALFLLAMLHCIIVERGIELGALAPYCRGVEQLPNLIKSFTPQRAQLHTGISAKDIERIALTFSQTPRAVCYGRVGISTQSYGSVCNWAINILNIITGNFDQRGGAMFTETAFDLLNMPPSMGIGAGSYNRYQSRVRALPEFSGELPAATLAEEMLTPGEGQIRGFITHAGNPVLSTPNGGQLDQALAGLEFMVSIDYYINETTRHADIILPPPSPVQRSHYDVALNLLAVRNVAKYARPILPKAQQARHDWEIFLALTDRLQALREPGFLRQKWTRKMRTQLLQTLGPEGLLALGIRLGPLGPGFNPLRAGLTLGQLRKQPHGVDLGPLRPCFTKRLSGGARIDLTPTILIEDLARLDQEFAKTSQNSLSKGLPLRLIGRRQLRNNNSWMHNLPKLMRGHPRCTLQIHASDAQRLAIQNGAMVTVSSRVGQITVEAELTQDIKPGVVSLPHGFGHQRTGMQLGTAQQHAGVSLNDLTDEQAIDPISGNAAFNGIPVKVQAVAKQVAPGGHANDTCVAQGSDITSRTAST